MIKRDIVETVYEYDKEGKLLKKTVTETHEEETNTITTYPSWIYCNDNLSTSLVSHDHAIATTKTNDCDAILATK